jgi:hypothetical protein
MPDSLGFASVVLPLNDFEICFLRDLRTMARDRESFLAFIHLLSYSRKLHDEKLVFSRMAFFPAFNAQRHRALDEMPDAMTSPMLDRAP